MALPLLLSLAALALVGCGSGIVSGIVPGPMPEPPPPPTPNRKPRPDRVEALEGLTLEDLDRGWFPRVYNRTEALVQLAQLIKGGDPKRIDPGDETIRFARLFTPGGGIFPMGPFPIYQEDIEAYEKQFIEKQRSHPTEIKIQAEKNFGLNKLGHPLVDLMKQMDPNYAKDFRGLPAFIKLASVWKEQIGGRNLNALYPGSGSHFAPLAVAMELIQKDEIDRADFTFTEIKDYSTDLERILMKGLELGIFDRVTIDKWKDFSSGAPNSKEGTGSEKSIQITYRGKEINIRYALKRSGESYYRKEYLKEANLVVFHDIDPWGDSFDILASMLIDRRDPEITDKKQLLIMEGKPIRGDYQVQFPKEMKQEELEGPYGHCYGNRNYPESGECVIKTARVFLLNDPALKQLADRYSEPSQLSSALHFYNGPRVSR